MVFIYAPDVPVGTGARTRRNASMSQSPQAQDRRSGTRALIDKMLAERQQMLVLYERVAGIEPYAAESASDELLQEFSQILVDYIATGHFGLYGRIAEGKERRRGVLSLAEELYPRIADTTEAAVAFNDAFENLDENGREDELARLLSELGEELAVRIELEDKLIAEVLGGA